MKPSSLQAIISLLGLGPSQARLPNAPWPHQTFRSSNAQPPDFQIEKPGTTETGLLFFSKFGWKDHNHDNLLIMSDTNELVWQSDSAAHASFKPQVLFGQPVLVYWIGDILPLPWGIGIGHVEILDNTYTHIYSISLSGKDENFVPAAGLNSETIPSFLDAHEALITPDNTILVTAFNTTPYDMSAFGGAVDGWMHDSLFFELDVETNEVLHQWSALEHIEELGVPYGDLRFSLGEMGKNKTHPYAFFHLNSVDKFSDGSYLISSRHTCSLYRVARDGTVEWILQGEGNKSSFSHGPGVSFCYQHDARILENSGTDIIISLFNNNNDFSGPVHESTGLFIALDTDIMKATLLNELADANDPLSAPVMGSVQSMDNGNIFVGYGYVPKMKEYDGDGNVAMTIQYGKEGDVSAYRSYRYKWVGKPKTQPDVYACHDGIDTQVYMSWNGSTEHTAWEIYSGNQPHTLRRRRNVASRGFETVTTVPGTAYFVQVEPRGVNVVSINSSVTRVQAEC